MFYNKLKGGRSLVIGPVHEDRPHGDYFIFTIDDFKFRKIHYYELKSQVKIPVSICSPPRKKDKFLAFDNYTGSVLAVTGRYKGDLTGIILRKKSDSSGPLFHRFTYPRHTISKAPIKFRVCVKDTIKCLYEPQ